MIAFVADVIRRTSGADAAIINGGGIRTSISKGKIKVGDVYAVVPFDDYIVAIMRTGRQIRETLEYGVSAVEERAGPGFPPHPALAKTAGMTCSVVIDGAMCRNKAGRRSP